MHCTTVIFMPPCLLTDDLKENYVEISQELLDNTNGNEHFLKIITGDETWVYCCLWCWNQKCNHQWVGKGTKFEIMLHVFFYWRGIVHYEFVPYGQVVKHRIIQRNIKTFERCYGLNCEKIGYGCCTMTKRRLTRSLSTVILQNIRHLSCPIHPILQT